MILEEAVMEIFQGLLYCVFWENMIQDNKWESRDVVIIKILQSEL